MISRSIYTRVSPVLVVVAAVMAGPVHPAEMPPPDGEWRLHRLARCAEHPQLAESSREAMVEALDLFHIQNGGDGIDVLESALAVDSDQPWLQLLLAQIYVMAGQGEPHCQPTGGPTAPSGNWSRDQARWLDRADELLADLKNVWPDDGLVDFLRADGARAGDDPEKAAEFDHMGRSGCSYRESLQFVRALRDLRTRPARVLEPIVPEYPSECARQGIQGLVMLDLLIDPRGRAVEVAVVGPADRRLAKAARMAADGGGYQAAQLGYYPVWSWLRVPVQFTLEN